MAPLTILALDQAECTAWACSDGTHGIRNIAARHEEKLLNLAERDGSRGFRLASWLADLLIETGTELVVIEDNTFNSRSTYAARAQANLRAWICTTCWAHDRRVIEVAPKDWEPWAKKHLGWRKQDGPDGDIADAQSMLAYVQTNAVGLE